MLTLCGLAQAEELKPQQKTRPTITEKGQDFKNLLLDFSNTQFLAYFHYNINTFNQCSTWGTGQESPSSWAPTGLDTDQWARAMIAAGMKGGILTCKHHDGFALWDSKAPDPKASSRDGELTEIKHDVGAAPVKTDVVAAFVASMRKHHLKVGLYYSIWDMHSGVRLGDFSTADLRFVKAQITELLTQYGDIDYLNIDGWTDMAGSPYFDELPFVEIYELVKSLQPNCLILNHSYEANFAHTEVPFADCAYSFRNKSYYFGDYKGVAAGSDCLQNTWFWVKGTKVNKDIAYLQRMLKMWNDHDGVYVLNIAPNQAGRLDDDAVAILADIAKAYTKPQTKASPKLDWGYGYDVTQNLAYRKTASQSSTDKIKQTVQFRAEIANDGEIGGSAVCWQLSRTEEEDNPWWQVDLGAEYPLDDIILWGCTTDSSITKDTMDNKLPKNMTLGNYKVEILNTEGQLIKTIEGKAQGTKCLHKAEGARGRYVRISKEGKSVLALAEVFVSKSEN